MNKKRPKYVSVSKTKLDWVHVFCFEFGRVQPGFKDEDQMRSIWQEHRERILAAWIELWPGTRPTCFWILEHPEINRDFFLYDANTQRPLLLDLGELTTSELQDDTEPAAFTTRALMAKLKVQ